jgi:hypothetical protein
VILKLRLPELHIPASRVSINFTVLASASLAGDLKAYYYYVITTIIAYQTRPDTKITITIYQAVINCLRCSAVVPGKGLST